MINKYEGVWKILSMFVDIFHVTKNISKLLMEELN